jgi:hypothetical protein
MAISSKPQRTASTEKWWSQRLDNKHLRRSYTAWGLGTLMLATITGCWGNPALEHRVEPNTAKSTLESVLNSWQDGASPESWQEKMPKVVVQDFDWKSGAKLQSYEFIGDPEAVDANLYCKVKLKLQIPGKGSREQTVTYLVGTSPVLTVFRAQQP